MSATASGTGIGVTRIGQIAINAKDVERAAAFYEDKLGLKLLFKAPPGLAFFDCGGVVLMLKRAEEPEAVHPWSLFVLCARNSSCIRQAERERGPDGG